MSAQDTGFAEQEQPESPEQEKAREEAAKEAVSSLDAVIKNTEARSSTQLDEFLLEQRQAKLFAASGMFGLKKKTVNMAIAEAFTKIEIGKAMGFNAAQSMMGISVISDRPIIESKLLAARMQELGYDWLVDEFRDQKTGVCTGIRLWGFFKGQPIMRDETDENGSKIPGEDGKPLRVQVSVQFTKKDADRIQMWEWDDKAKRKVQKPLSERDTYKNFPDDMYFARCVGKFQKRYVPKALAGGVMIREEMDDATADEPLSVPGNTFPGAYFKTGSTELAEATAEKKLAEIRKQDEQRKEASADAPAASSAAAANSSKQTAGKPKFF
jgi:DNA segregation ATPase FtsK/SpoIIIE-like protein